MSNYKLFKLFDPLQPNMPENVKEAFFNIFSGTSNDVIVNYSIGEKET